MLQLVVKADANSEFVFYCMFWLFISHFYSDLRKLKIHGQLFLASKKKNCEFFPPFMAVLIPVVTRKKQHFNCGQCSDNLEAECAGLWFCLDLPVLPLEQHSGSQGKDERANKNRKISQTLSLKDCMFYFRSIKADSISIKHLNVLSSIHYTVRRKALK